MKSEDAVKLLEDLAMSVLEHTYMKTASIILEGQRRRADTATAAKMQEIQDNAEQTLTRTVTIALEEIIKRPPTNEEVRGVTFVLDEPLPPYLRSSNN